MIGNVEGESVSSNNNVLSESMGNVILFVKQKTAYEMLRSLVGSEMCIRDSTSSS